MQTTNNATPSSPHSTPPRLGTGESLHLDWLWPLPTSMARREHKLWVSGVRWWVGRVRSVFKCAERVDLHANNKQCDPILASFDTTPSPHRRITAPRLVVAFAHIHGEAGTPALGIWSGLVGRKKGPVLYVYVCRRGGFPCKSTPSSPHSTPPRLRTGESLHLDWLWPLPTSMARREHQLWVSGVRWWVGRVRFCICRKEGVDYLFLCKSTPSSLYSTPPRLRTGESLHLDWLWPLPTSMARREHQRWVSGVRWRVGRVRCCVCVCA